MSSADRPELDLKFIDSARRENMKTPEVNNPRANKPSLDKLLPSLANPKPALVASTCPASRAPH